MTSKNKTNKQQQQQQPKNKPVTMNIWQAMKNFKYILNPHADILRDTGALFSENIICYGWLHRGYSVWLRELETYFHFIFLLFLLTDFSFRLEFALILPTEKH